MTEHDEHENEIEIEAIGIEVSTQPIELYKVFKIANLVGGGGEAKHIISEGYVAVNGELETRKRRKMYDGDFFEFNQEYYVVVCDTPVQEQIEEAEPKPKLETKAKKDKAAKKSSKASSPKPANKKQKDTVLADKQTQSEKPKNSNGRSSIDFF